MNAPFKSAADNKPVSTRELAAAVTQQPELPSQPVTRMTAYFEARRGSRYMEENCAPATYPGWETLPLKECTYGVKRANDPLKKSAKVIMLNAEPDQLARWVVSTCLEVVGNASNKCTKAIGAQIIGQSGAQFPVAGIVFEDILPEDGKYEVFAFRNGVTVRMNGVTHLGMAQPSLFYLYAFSVLTNVITMWLHYSGQLPDYPFTLRFWLMSLGASVAVVVISRYAAIRSARAAVILERAKRKLVADESR